MPKIAPIFGGISISIFFFIVNELLKNKKIALQSSLILAVLPFHAYQTSHASPLTMGHFFMMLSIYFFIKYRKDFRYIIPLFLSTLLLIMSHHLTTYFYLISLVFIVFFENASKKEWAYSLKKDVFYIVFASLLIFSYWIFIAIPVYDSFMNSGIKIGSLEFGSNFTILLFYILFFLMFIILHLKKRYNIFSKKNEETFNSSLFKFIFVFVICLSAMIVFSIFKMPWTNFSFTLISIIYSIPLLLIISFGATGFRITRYIKNGYFIRGWILAITLSFLYGLITNNSTLYPHRHLEYIMAPVSIISIFGIRKILLGFNSEYFSESLKKITNINIDISKKLIDSRIVKKRQIGYVFVIIILVTTNAMSIYPSHVALNASYEAISDDNLDATNWMVENLDINSTVVASDHRLARLTESMGFNTTLDETILLWSVENFSDYINELEGIGKNHSKISHIMIDDIMKERVVHVGFRKIVYMTNESYEKFSTQPFELIYRNATLNNFLEEEHWTEIYRVNWSYFNLLS